MEEEVEGRLRKKEGQVGCTGLDWSVRGTAPTFSSVVRNHEPGLGGGVCRGFFLRCGAVQWWVFSEVKACAVRMILRTVGMVSKESPWVSLSSLLLLLVLCLLQFLMPYFVSSLCHAVLHCTLPIPTTVLTTYRQVPFFSFPNGIGDTFAKQQPREE